MAKMVISHLHAVVAGLRDDYKRVLQSILEYGPAKSTEDPAFRFTRPERTRRWPIVAFDARRSV